MMSHALTLFAVLFLASTVLSTRLAPLETASDDRRVEGEYIVLFKSSLSDTEFKAGLVSITDSLETLADSSALIRTYQIGATFKAAHFKLSASALFNVQTNPTVELVSENAVVEAIQAPSCTEQSDVIWNLDRVNTRDIDMVDDNYRYGYAGEGVDVYVIDTGVQVTHQEFAGRATWGANFADATNKDCNGHGTHVAGTIAGEVYGVAKKTNIIAVKVLSCGGSGTNAGVIAGVEWTASQAQSRGKPSVANMSLGGGTSAALNQAVAAAVQSGVTFAVAAGNSNTDACFSSPASEPLAITVAATTVVEEANGEQADRRASFSNYGTCVDIAAPGQLIKAAWIDQSGIPPDTAHNTISGTSMASPHVAGVAAIILSANPTFSPAQVESAMLKTTTDGAIDLNCSNDVCAKTPNKLLYTHCD